MPLNVCDIKVFCEEITTVCVLHGLATVTTIITSEFALPFPFPKVMGRTKRWCSEVV